MARQRPDLIVPIRDRRQRKRYLTLKNFGWFMLAAVVIFIGISIRSEMRGRPAGDFGRLFGNEVATSDVDRKPVEVVNEAPPPAPAAIEDANGADPSLVNPTARSQWLQGAPAATDTVALQPVTAATVAPPPVPTAKGDFVVVGGPEGVAIVKKDKKKPVLSGGFGRQN